MIGLAVWTFVWLKVKTLVAQSGHQIVYHKTCVYRPLENLGHDKEISHIRETNLSVPNNKQETASLPHKLLLNAIINEITTATL